MCSAFLASSCVPWSRPPRTAAGAQQVESSTAELVALLRDAAQPLIGGPSDYDALMTLVGEARFVMLGEATHGTREFYRERARITQRLIEEKGFNAIAVEADWPKADRVGRYIRAESTDTDAEQALSDFREFPSWMWRNNEVRDLVD